MIHLGLVWLAALGFAAQPTLTLTSDTACPSAESVEVALQGLGLGETTPAASVKIRAVTSGLEVELGWPDSPQSQHRLLTVDGDCVARARAAAIVVAAWLGSLPTTPLAVPVVEPTKPTVIGAPPSTSPNTSLTITPTPSPGRWTLGLGVGAGTSGDLDLAPALVMEGTRRLSRKVGLAVAAATTGPRQRTVGPGTSHFLRPTMMIMGRIQLLAGTAQVGFDAGLAGGLTVAWGTDYPNNDTQHAFDWGPAGGFRVLVSKGRLRPWLAARLTYWVLSQRLLFEDLRTSAVTATAVSSVEAWLAAGCDIELL
jgi:hypothetical protein